MSPWLIQRAKTKTDKASQIVGIDSLLSFDYMGAAEFEYGALPKALKALYPVLDNVQVYKTEIKKHDGQGLFIICTPEQKDEVKSWVEAEVRGVYHRLKEGTSMERALKNEKYADFNVWWDIENNWFAVFGKQNADNVVLALHKCKAKAK